MNKKKKGNLILVGLAIILGLTLIDFSPKNSSYQEEIRAFIISNLENGVDYRGKAFYEINEAFLLSQDAILSNFMQLKDSISNQLDLISASQQALLLSEKLSEAREQLAALRLDNTADYLLMDIQLKKEFSRHNIDEEIMQALNREEMVMNSRITNLNEVLDLFNLSIYNIDFDKTESISYLHSFELQKENHVSEHLAVFELSTGSREVISYKEI